MSNISEILTNSAAETTAATKVSELSTEVASSVVAANEVINFIDGI